MPQPKPRLPIGRTEALALVALARQVRPRMAPERPLSARQARAAREALALTVEGVAVATDLTPARIANFETGVNLDTHVARSLRQALECRGVAFVSDDELEAVVIRREAA